MSTTPLFVIIFALIAIIIVLIWFLIDNSKFNISELLSDINSLRRENDALKNEKKNNYGKKAKDKWKISAQCVYTTSLSQGSKGEEDYISFDATYTFEVIEISEHKIKVKSLDVTTNRSQIIANGGKQQLLDFMENNWISKIDADLVMDDAYYRMVAIEDIIENG